MMEPPFAEPWTDTSSVLAPGDVTEDTDWRGFRTCYIAVTVCDLRSAHTALLMRCAAWPHASGTLLSEGEGQLTATSLAALGNGGGFFVWKGACRQENDSKRQAPRSRARSRAIRRLPSR
jgi:hypothetical protein